MTSKKKPGRAALRLLDQADPPPLPANALRGAEARMVVHEMFREAERVAERDLGPTSGDAPARGAPASPWLPERGLDDGAPDDAVGAIERGRAEPDPDEPDYERMSPEALRRAARGRDRG